MWSRRLMTCSVGKQHSVTVWFQSHKRGKIFIRSDFPTITYNELPSLPYSTVGHVNSKIKLINFVCWSLKKRAINHHRDVWMSFR